LLDGNGFCGEIRAMNPARPIRTNGTRTPAVGAADRGWRWRQFAHLQPLYQQIKALITQSLQSGEWKPGELIPSEVELAGRFKVSQGTVRKAIDELAAENLVMRRRARAPSCPPTTRRARISVSCA
jgi:GntR family transcriptional regulator